MSFAVAIYRKLSITLNNLYVTIELWHYEVRNNNNRYKSYLAFLHDTK